MHAAMRYAWFVNLSMAGRAHCEEILGGIASTGTPECKVMNFKVLTGTATLAAPAVAPQDPHAQRMVFSALQPLPFVFL